MTSLTYDAHRPGGSRHRAARIRVPSRAVVLSAWVLLVVVLAQGCSGGGSTPPPPPPVVRFPASPDEAIRALRDAYEGRRLAGLDSLLAPAFRFHFAQQDIDSFAVSATWERGEELRSAERLFGGEEGRWPWGGVRAPIDPIFPFGTQIRAQDGSEWRAGDQEGTYVRPYDAALIIQYIDGCIDIVSGTQTFQVVDMSRVGGPNGEAAEGFAVLSWRDGGLSPRPPGPPPEPLRHVASWGYVKASFREIEP